MTRTILPCLCGTGFLEEIDFFFFYKNYFTLEGRKKELQQKDPQSYSSKTIANNLKKKKKSMCWHVKLCGPAMQFYFVFMMACFWFLVLGGSTEPSTEPLWVMEGWNSDNVPTSKWICLKHVDVVSCFFLSRLHNTCLPRWNIYSSRRSVFPRRQKKKENNNNRAEGRENLWHAFVRLSQTQS